MSPTARMLYDRPPLPVEWQDTALQWRLEGVTLGLRAVGLSGRVYRVDALGRMSIEMLDDEPLVLHLGEMVRAMLTAQDHEDLALSRARRELQEAR